MHSQISIIKSIEKSNIILVFSYIIVFLIFLDSTFASIASIFLIIAMITLISSRRFYLLFPILIFFGQLLVLPLDFNVFHVYSILAILKFLFSKKLRIPLRILIPLLMLVIYSIAIVTFRDFSVAGAIIISSICIVTIIIEINADKKLFSIFMKFFILSAILSGLYGLITSNYIDSFYLISNTRIVVNRNIGTFTDPNHYGFFLNIAIFFIFTGISNISLLKKIVFSIILYVLLISTASITAIVCNALGLLFLFLISKNRTKSFVYSAILMITIYLVVIIGLAEEWPFIINIVSRVEYIISVNDSAALLSSNRTLIWKEHFHYYINQDFLRLSFGGNFITDYGRDTRFLMVSHQAFLDMLLNFGIFGTFIFFLLFIDRCIKLFYNYKRKPEDTIYLPKLMMKYVWFFYAFGLSMFPGWSFQFFFLL